MHELYPNAIKRIAEYSKNLKFFYLVREPFSRIESHWMELVNSDIYVRYDFNKAIRDNQNILVHSGNYLRQLEQWYKYFPKEAIKVVFFEDLISNPKQVYADCFKHIGVDSSRWNFEDIIHENRAADKRIPRNILNNKVGKLSMRFINKLFSEKQASRFKRQLFFRKVSERPRWDSESRLWVKSQLDKVIATFLEKQEKPLDFWKSTKPDRL